MSLIKDALDKAQKEQDDSSGNSPEQPAQQADRSGSTDVNPSAEPNSTRFWLIVIFLFLLALVVGGEFAYLFLYVL